MEDVVQRNMKKAFQNWRAIAVAKEGVEHLLFMGNYSSEIKQNIAKAFAEVLTFDEQKSIVSIESQRWYGSAEQGHWDHKGNLPIPAPKLEEIEELTLVSV